MIGFFLAACATTADDRRGYGGKKNIPKEAQEEVVPQDNTSQPR
jgi:hypothetical protein